VSSSPSACAFPQLRHQGVAFDRSERQAALRSPVTCLDASVVDVPNRRSIGAPNCTTDHAT
jgi:hypothetical protein